MVSRLSKLNHFFPRRHGIWLVLNAVQMFLSLPMGMVTLAWLCVFLFTKPFLVQKLFSKQLFITQKSWKTKAFFRTQIFITILKGRNSSLKGFGYFTAFSKRNVLVEELNKWLERVKTKKSLAGYFFLSVQLSISQKWAQWTSKI